MQRCSVCDGSGQVRWHGYSVPCSACEGTGAQATRRRRVYRYWRLGWFIVSGVVLCCAAGAVFSVLLQDVFDASLPSLGRQLHYLSVTMAAVVAMALMTLLWLTSGGPPRIGRGFLRRRAKP